VPPKGEAVVRKCGCPPRTLRTSSSGGKMKVRQYVQEVCAAWRASPFREQRQRHDGVLTASSEYGAGRPVRCHGAMRRQVEPHDTRPANYTVNCANGMPTSEKLPTQR